MATANKIMIGIDDQVIELTGADKEAFLADQEVRESESLLLETIRLERETARESAINKLATIAGLTEQEIDSII
jgi:hypothetical protein